MAKPEQLLIIEPDTELKFRGPFNVSVLTYMRLTNPTDKKILFKIKTTAPKRYCVRPNSGVLDSKSTMEVAIALQPFVFDPNEKNKHKFMVQSLVAPEGDYDGDRLWKEISPEQLMDSKLKCVFELPVDNNTVIDLSSSKIKQTDGTTTDIISGKQEVSQLSSEPEKVGIKSGDPSYDYIKTNDEIRKLREEESQLRQENLELKEQLLKLKMASHSAAAASSSSATSGSSSGAAAQYQNPYAPPASANQQIPTLYIAVAIAIAIFGLLIGKFAL